MVYISEFYSISLNNYKFLKIRGKMPTKKRNKGWILIFVAVILFAVNFFTIWNQSMITAKWASMLGTIIGLIICPILFLLGIIMLLQKTRK